MTKSAVNVCLFNTYGTVLNIGEAVKRHAGRIGISWEQFATIWRTKQLEYALAHSVMGQYKDFRALTGAALDHAMLIFGLRDPELRANLLRAHETCRAFKDVAITLPKLRQAGIRTALLSNETRQVLDGALAYAGIADHFDITFSVEELGYYRPDPRGFDLICRQLGEPAGNIAYCSRAAWDVAGGAAYGFPSYWLNRGNSPREYPDLPVTEISDLLGLPGLLTSKSRRQLGKPGAGVAGAHESRADQDSLCADR